MADEVRRPLLARGELLKHDGERYSGGSPKYHPRSFEEAWKHLSPQAENLAFQVANLQQQHVGKHVLFEVELLPNYLAASSYPSQLLDGSSLYLVGTKPSTGVYKTQKQLKKDVATRTLLVAGDRSTVKRLAREIVDGPAIEPRWKDFQKIESISLPNPDRVVRAVSTVEARNPITWEAVLSRIGRTPAEKREWNDEFFEAFVRQTREAGGDVDVKYRRTVGNVTFVPILLDLQHTEDLTQLNLLRALRPMPKLRPLPGDGLRSAASSKALKPPFSIASDLETIAVFDGGVPSNCPAFGELVREFDLTPAPKDPDCVDHGAFVTGAALYGPLAAEKELPAPRAKVDHFRVFPLPITGKFDEDLMWFLDQVVEHAPDYPLVNLSAGPDCSVAEFDDAPHVWTATLDQLAKESGTVFVVAAGNNGEDDASLGFNRVLAPADMVNGIGVGACDSLTGGRVTATPYSASGPGRDGMRMQPVGVQFGGTMERQFLGIDAHGHLAGQRGTSFAAPAVCGGLADLKRAILSNATPGALRVFPVHFVQRSTRKHDKHRVGYGRLPLGYSAHLECAEHECHLLYEDTIPRGKTVSFPLPLPDFDPSEVDYNVTVRWTLAYLSGTDPSTTCDYTMDGLEMAYRPNEYVRTITEKGTKRVLDVLDIKAQGERLEELRQTHSISVGSAPQANSRYSPWGPEHRRRDAGKWETLVSRRVPPTPRSKLNLPRIDLSYLRREGVQLADTDEGLEITLLVTVSATKGTNIYDQVRVQFDQLVPVDVHVGV